MTSRRILLTALAATASTPLRLFAQERPLTVDAPPVVQPEPKVACAPTATGPTELRGQKVMGSDGCPLGDGLRQINPANGQQRQYVVLTPEERAKGFIRPLRRTYTHLKCGTDTSIMSQAIVETLARDPTFYKTGYCVKCGGQFPNSELVWKGTKEHVGS